MSAIQPQKFRTYELSIEFYKLCKTVRIPSALKDQLMRASSSVTLNLSEGSAKLSQKERIRFYSIAFASVKEVQAIIRLEELEQLAAKADHLAASCYKLVHQ
jgi:four helix bundle protein